MSDGVFFKQSSLVEGVCSPRPFVQVDDFSIMFADCHVSFQGPGDQLFHRIISHLEGMSEHLSVCLFVCLRLCLFVSLMFCLSRVDGCSLAG